jgi:hypothetical protein
MTYNPKTIRNDLDLFGTTLTLDSDNLGSANISRIRANRGNSGTPAEIRFNPATSAWQQSADGVTFSSLALNGDDFLPSSDAAFSLGSDGYSWLDGYFAGQIIADGGIRFGDNSIQTTAATAQTITLTGDVTGSGTSSFAATIANGAVTYAKIQNVSATDKLLGRSTAGAGVVEEIVCTPFARSILDDLDAAAVRATIGAGTGTGTVTAVTGAAPIASTGGTTPQISLNDDGVTFAKMQNIATDTLIGRAAAGTGDPESITLTAAGRALLDDVSTTAQRTTLGLGTVAILDVDTDTALTANSDVKVASQKAVRTYVDTAVTGLLDFKGGTDCSTNPNYPAASKGDSYVVTVAGKIGGASGTVVDVGDVYAATADNAGGSEASVGASWLHLEHNLVGALLAQNNLSDLTSASSARSNLGLGTLATQSGTFSGTSSGTNTGDQTITLTGNVTGSGTGTFATTIANDAVTYAKIQNVSATDKVLGRSSAGSGDIEEIACTPFARSILDDLDAAAVRATIGAGSASGSVSDVTGVAPIASTGGITPAISLNDDGVTFAKMQNIATDTLIGRATAGTGDPESITLTAAGRALLDDADASAQRTTLGLGTLATQSGTFSGTSSGTNTGDQTITLTGNVTGSGTGSFATTIANDAVTFAKFQNLTTDRLVGRDTAATGDAEEISVGGGLEFTGSAGIQRSALTGDVTASAGSNATTIANGVVTYAKIQNVSATDKVLGRSTAGAGSIEEITLTAAGRALIDDADATAQRATLGLGTLATQSGTFSGTSSGTNTGDQTITLTGDVTGSGTSSFAATIANDTVTYAKIQNVSATDRLLGRSTAGAGDIEEIVCTPFARSILDDLDAASVRATIGAGSSSATIGGTVAINQIAYGSGTSTIQGSSTFLFDGYNMLLGATATAGGLTNRALTFKGGPTANFPVIELQRDTASATVDAGVGQLDFYNGTTRTAQIISAGNGSTDSGNLLFFTKSAGGTLLEGMRLHGITSGGLSAHFLKIGNDTATGIPGLWLGRRLSTVNLSDVPNAFEAHANTSLTLGGPAISAFTYYDGTNAGASNFVGYQSRGSQASPTATQSGDTLVGFVGRGHDGTNFRKGTLAAATFTGAWIYATENYTSSALGSMIDFFTTPNGSVTSARRFRIGENGNVGIGNFGAVTANPVSTLTIQADGSASAPALTLGATADGDTGLWHPTADTIAISTGAAERLRIASTGNVTIGSTTSTSMFNVGSAAQFQVTSAGIIAAAVGITSSGTITFSSLTSAGGLVLANGSGVLSQLADVAVGQVLTSGGVGSNPTYSSSPTLTTSLTVPLLIGGTATSSTLILESTSGSGTTDAIIFKTASQSERMRIVSGGNVSIGSATTTSMFNVGTAAQFQVGSDGDIDLIKNVPYSWPAANASGVLTNNGTGGLTWASVGGGTIGGSIAAGQIAYGSGPNTIQGNSLTYDGTNVLFSNSLLTITLGQNSASQLIRVINATSGTGSSAQIAVESNGGGQAQFNVYSSAFTTSGLNIASSAQIRANSNLSGGLVLTAANGPIIFGPSDTSTMKIVSTGLIPIVNNTIDLGSDGYRWHDGYFGPTTLHVGTSLSDEGTLSYNTSTNIFSIDTISAGKLRLGATPANIELGGTSGNQTIAIGGGAAATGTKTVEIGNQITGSSVRLLDQQILLGSAATTGTTETVIQTLSPVSNKSYFVETRIIGRRTGGGAGTAGDTAIFVMMAKVKDISGDAGVFDVANIYTSKDQSTWNAEIIASGSNALIRVIGAASNDISWSATTTVKEI